MPISHVNANIYRTQPPPITHIDELPDPYYANSQNSSQNLMPPPSPQAANFHSTRALVDRPAPNVKPVDLNNTGNLFATVKTDNKNEQIIEVEVVAEDTKPLV